MYIKYTLVHFAILLIHQIFRAFPLPVTISFAVEALSFGLWSSFGLLHRSDNVLDILVEVPFLSLFLKLVVLLIINTWCFFLICTFINFIIMKSSGIVFVIPLHTIVHHEVLLTWWWWLENFVNHYFIWKINSHLIQAIVVPRQSEHHAHCLSYSPPSFSYRTCWRLHISQLGYLLWNINFNSWNISYGPWRSKRLWSPDSKPLSMVH